MLAQFRNYVGIQQITLHQNFTGSRLRRPPRSGTSLSKRGPEPRSSAFRPGRDDLCSRCHSSIGTNTAASTPLRVTTCGPFLSVVSSNSLKRAFASCTCHAANGYLQSLAGQQTSQQTSQLYHSIGSAQS